MKRKFWHSSFFVVVFIGSALLNVQYAESAYPSDSARTKNWSAAETLTEPDLEGQYDVIHTWVNASMDSSSGHKHDATTNEGPKIAVLASTVTGDTAFSGAISFTKTDGGPDTDIDGDLSVGQQLEVTGKATFSEDVSMNKNLSVNTLSVITGIVSAPSTYHVSSSTSHGTSSTSPVDLNDMSITFTPSHANNPVLVMFSCYATHATVGGKIEVILDVDGSDEATTQRIDTISNNAEGATVFFQHYATYSKASHTFKVQFETDSGTVTVQDRAMTIIEFKQN